MMLVVLFFTPNVSPRMFTLKVQEAPTASEAPERLTLLEPAAAVIVPPPQEPASPFGVATNKPAGSGSVKLTFVSGAAMLFVILNIRPMVWCKRTVGAAKDLVNSVALATVT
jgi:hypothetical protein